MVENRREDDHIFISYATEDGALAEWLSLKLTSEGYYVWCDRYKLLGGEPWPDDINKALETKTFRMLHLVSKSSLHKPNPSKERQKALSIGKARGLPDFLIPLNIDNTPPSDLNWQISDINFIPFWNWHSGYAQLLKKLLSIDTPRPNIINGGLIAASAYLPPEVLTNKEEYIFSNCIAFKKIPQKILKYELSLKYDSYHSNRNNSLLWPRYKVSERVFLSFIDPPEDFYRDYDIQLTESYAILNPSIEGIDTANIVSNLLKQSITKICLERELKRIRYTNNFGETEYKDEFYFPSGLVQNDFLNYSFVDGSKRRIKISGKSDNITYRLAIEFEISRNMGESYVAIFKIKPFISFKGIGRDDKEVRHRSTAQYRKKITKSWHNDDFGNRTLAVFSFLSKGLDEIIVGSGEQQLIISSVPIYGMSSLSINDTIVDQYNKYLSIPLERSNGVSNN